jgi:hypothetical protein
MPVKRVTNTLNSEFTTFGPFILLEWNAPGKNYIAAQSLRRDKARDRCGNTLLYELKDESFDKIDSKTWVPRTRRSSIRLMDVVQQASAKSPASGRKN